MTARVYGGLGPRAGRIEPPRTSGSTLEPETRLQRLPLTMALAIGILLVGALVLGLLPGIHSVANHAAASFIDSAGYAGQALHQVHVVISAPTASNWTGSGLALGFLSAGCACVVAAVGLYGGTVVKRLPSIRALGKPVDALHRVHSGHVGDYIAFMMLGIGTLAAFVGLPLR